MNIIIIVIIIMTIIILWSLYDNSEYYNYTTIEITMTITMSVTTTITIANSRANSPGMPMLITNDDDTNDDY